MGVAGALPTGSGPPRLTRRRYRPRSLCRNHSTPNQTTARCGVGMFSPVLMSSTRPLDHLNGAGLLWRISGGKISSMEIDWATIRDQWGCTASATRRRSTPLAWKRRRDGALTAKNFGQKRTSCCTVRSTRDGLWISGSYSRAEILHQWASYWLGRRHAERLATISRSGHQPIDLKRPALTNFVPWRRLAP